ncbi:hypothetical protein N802_08910 [Knoellia sinensis KCTC 19936]|uniref:Uncharacterized protein n=1 Tax=Knoellia sinensis KCTC 19936 TaxID=1385520 RepID=A0A0A0J994_9MICO|nr:hypothetical protein [Knoellia sinensis]KGN33985.1 hypothetical protein N802_08910 [Knoellia sinensis KCTC 19936]
MRDINQTIQVDGFIGGIFNGPTTIGGPAEEAQTYTVRKARLLPATDQLLSVVASLMSIGSLLVGAEGVRRLWRARPDGLGDAVSATVVLQAFGALALLALLLMLSTVLWSLRRLAKHRLMHFSKVPFLPVLAGVTNRRGHGQLALLRLKGTCVRCGGRLKFFNMATAWHTGENGRRVVDERESAAQCVRNPRHWFQVDIADKLLLDVVEGDEG